MIDAITLASRPPSEEKEKMFGLLFPATLFIPSKPKANRFNRSKLKLEACSSSIESTGCRLRCNFRRRPMEGQTPSTALPARVREPSP